LLPALALANGVTWLQPRLQRIQTLYPYQSTLWCVGRALLGKTLVKQRSMFRGVSSTLVAEASPSFDFAARRRCRF
jgi:hypothetical protein